MNNKIIENGIQDLKLYFEYELLDQLSLFIMQYFSDLLFDNVKLIRLVLSVITYSTLGKIKPLIVSHPIIQSNLIPLLMHIADSPPYEHMLAWKLIRFHSPAQYHHHQIQN